MTCLQRREKSWRPQIYSWWLISKTQNCISWERKSYNVARTIRKISGTAVHLNVDCSYHSWKQIKQNTHSMALFLPNPHSQHKITTFNKFRTILFFLYGVRKEISRYREKGAKSQRRTACSLALWHYYVLRYLNDNYCSRLTVKVTRWPRENMRELSSLLATLWRRNPAVGWDETRNTAPF